ncbi:hypothetical protein QFZ56_002841 [Streptomyces achromogenes]|uniref:Secreted protein n=1 Tax=Streptomyces achromogenes TaxID=67255 RepID=A0ABU0Q224_STRAH|nr:hypothetical protein [Streptomyces achromogenes]
MSGRGFASAGPLFVVSGLRPTPSLLLCSPAPFLSLRPLPLRSHITVKLPFTASYVCRASASLPGRYQVLTW